MKIIHNSEGKSQNSLKDKKKELYDMLNSVPAPSSRFNLSTSQKYWWYFFGKELIKTNSFAKLDQIHLQSAAYWLDTRNQVLKIIAIKNKESEDLLGGLVQTFKTGSNNISAYVTIVKDADKALIRISEHFGLSIKDRIKLTTPKDIDPDQMNLFEDFLNQKTQ